MFWNITFADGEKKGEDISLYVCEIFFDTFYIGMQKNETAGTHKFDIDITRRGGFFQVVCVRRNCHFFQAKKNIK